MRLKRNFFNRNTVTIARDLLGKYLCRRISNNVICAKITETEAYCGQKDLACHASKGLTPRTKVMFGLPGHAYIYLIYGMYHCLNIVTREKGYPEAVLIRGAEIADSQEMIDDIKNNKNLEKILAIGHSPLAVLNGPGKICRSFKIDRTLNGIDICKSKELWTEEGEYIKQSQIKSGKRVGVNYAGKWKDKLWRFWID